ncbi:MAG: hypothetical protein QOG75_4811, partial [Mycobacterium sp.]|nr:hypothetical protein [Mycobacterium sp.]
MSLAPFQIALRLRGVFERVALSDSDSYPTAVDRIEQFVRSPREFVVRPD